MNVISKDELIRGLLEAKTLEGVIPVYKEWGRTPLETLQALQAKYPALIGVPLSYAGRLDPLAEGLMLVLVGETNKDRERYLHLEKTYEVEILFGIKTDTGDLFGVPKNCVSKTTDSPDSNILENVTAKDFEVVLESFIGRQQFPYPAYSSKTVQGKPLFQWMNEGRIAEIEIPKTDVEIYSLKLLNGLTKVTSKDILEKVEKALSTVKGDFRYGEIKSGWQDTLKDKGEDKADFYVTKIQCKCSSGTYMRVLAEEIGKKVGLPALAYSIKRTDVGGVELSSSIK